MDSLAPTPHGRILAAVHRDGALSRSELADRFGVNRSTIASQVAALVDAGLVRELAPERLGRVGRPSPLVVARSEVVAIAASPEFDALTVAVVGLGARVLERVRLPAARSVEEVAAGIGGAVDRWRAAGGRRAVAVGVAVPGLVDAAGRVARAPRLGWVGVDLRLGVAQRVGLPVRTGNDASLGARAEHLFGAARGTEDVLYLNGGASGIGGGAVAGGRLLRGARGFAGELGHTSTTGGELERAVSRDALLEALRLDPGATEEALAAAMAATTDGGARATMDGQRATLARSLADALHILDPAVIVLGGFLAAYADDDLLARIAAVALPEAAADLSVVPASLGADRQLIGAAELALEPLLADPLGTLAG